MSKPESSLLKRAKGTLLGIKTKYFSPVKTKDVVLNLQAQKQMRTIGASAPKPRKVKAKAKSQIVYWPKW